MRGRTRAALALWTIISTGWPQAGEARASQPAVTSATDLAATLQALPPGPARDAALRAVSPAQLADVSALLALKADSERLAGRTADALAIGTLAVECAERSGDERATARALAKLGAVTNARAQFGESATLLQRSIDVSRRLDDRPTLAEALGLLSFARFIGGDTDGSLAASTEALAIHRALGAPADIATSLNFVAMAERRRGRYDVAVAHYEEAIVLAEQAGAAPQLARTLNNLAVAERERGNNDHAIALYERSHPINERLGNRSGAANTLSNLGMSYEDIGRNDLALDAFLKSLATTDAIGDRVNSANTLGNLGFLYREQGDDAVALGYYARALALYEQIGHTDGIARILDFRARIHVDRGEFAEAEPLYRRALELRRALNDKAGAAVLEIQLGAFFEAQGAVDRAVGQYERGIAQLDALGERRSLSFALLRMASVQRKRGDHRAALDAARRAKDAAEATGQDARIWATELAAGRAWRGLGDRAEAMAAFERAIARIETLRDGAAGLEDSRERAFERQTDPYREMVALLADAGQVDAALGLAERAKGRVLLDVLRHGRADISRVMTPAERDAERRLNAEIVLAAAQVQRLQRAGAAQAAAAADAARALGDARTRAEALRTAIYAAHPDLRVQRSEAPIVDAADLAALAGDRQTALVEFAVTPEVTFAFVVTGGDRVVTTLHALPGPAAVQGLVDGFVSALARRDLGFRRPGRAVSDAVFAPLAPRLRGITRLVIVPDGPLWDLPFPALLLPDGRFVVQQYTVAYATSLTALREQRARVGRGDRTRAAAAFGNPMGGATNAGGAGLRGEALAPLLAAAREARAVARVYGPRSRAWVEREATEARFKREAGGYAVVHVATHGLLNNVDPLSSYLALAASRDPDEDGRLQARELLGTELHAQLVVLSGCDTAKGGASRGEGVIGLTWALFIAGVPSTIVSQWQVESDSTEQLMIGLHRRLAGPGPTAPAAALRGSALALLASERYRHPFYWAGFVAIGDGLRPLGPGGAPAREAGPDRHGSTRTRARDRLPF